MKKPSAKSTKENLDKVYLKRFLMLMKLIKIDRMLKNAKIVYPEK
jgi:hypothetical protein